MFARILRILRWLGPAAGVVAVMVTAGPTLVSAPHDPRASSERSQRMLHWLLREQIALDAVKRTGSARYATEFHAATARYDAAFAAALSAAGADPHARADVLAEAAAARRWHVAAAAVVADVDSDDPAKERARRQLFDAAVSKASEHEAMHAKARAAVRRASRERTVALIALIALLAACIAWWVIAWRRSMSQRYRRDRQLRDGQVEFTRALQAARSEREVQRMLKRQLERAIDNSRTTVFNRNNSDNRLEAVTAVPADSPLADAVPDAEPYDCVAVRMGQSHERLAEENPLLACDLCGGLTGSTTCVPSLVGGEVIGSVLVEHRAPLREPERRQLDEAVFQAAPVLANMRNLRLAEARAATDALTGLPNRRAGDETLKRMIAHAARSVSDCAVVLFDLDHFKKVNDVYGHDKGDELLAAVGDKVSSTLRAADFVARWGGEEFMVVLPGCDVDGAVLVCDKLRAGISSITVSGVPTRPTASFGVAVFPGDAGDPDSLLRGADRALYDAKGSGRNCVRAVRNMSNDEAATAARELLEEER